MSADDGIIVEFEVLPPAEGEPSAKEVLRDLNKQLRNPSSRLRSDASPFGRFARLAQLSTDDDEEEEPVPVPVSVPVSVPAPVAVDEVRVVDLPPVEAPDGLAKLSKLSNSELIERIHSLEHELTRTATKKPVVIQEPAPKWRAVKTQTLPLSAPQPAREAPVGVRSRDVEEMDSRLMQMRRLLEEKEKELREAQERSTTFERRSEQVEQRLREREQLLAHAKKMWMQETERSSAYEKKLSEIEKKYVDQEKQSSVVNDSYNAANNAVQQLHQFVGANEGLQVPKSQEFDSWSSMRMTQGGLAGGAKPAVHQPRPPNSFDSGTSQPRSAPSFPRSAPQPQAGEQAETNAERYRRLCVLNNAVLHEDELLQIGVKAEFSGREGQLSVFFGNKCNAALQSFTVQYFVREERSLHLVAAPINTHLDARDQIMQRLSVTLLEPFVEPPWMRVQFLMPDTSPRRLQMQFPIVLTKFMRGRELAADDFFRYWRQHNFVLNEVSSVVYLAARFQAEGSLNRRNVAKALLFNGAMFLHSGIDSNSDNFVLVSQLNPPATPAFDVQFGSLGEDREGGLTVVRVEMGSGRFAGKARVVVRSSDNATARAVCEGIVAQLVEPGARAIGGVIAH